jgi:hypothetical protein
MRKPRKLKACKTCGESKNLALITNQEVTIYCTGCPGYKATGKEIEEAVNNWNESE